MPRPTDSLIPTRQRSDAVGHVSRTSLFSGHEVEQNGKREAVGLNLLLRSMLTRDRETCHLWGLKV